VIVLDSFNPWNSIQDGFRINNKSHKKVSVTYNDHPYEVIVSSNSKDSHLLDMEVVDGKSKEIIEKYTGIESHLSEDGLVVSTINSKSTKSNVVVYDNEVVVFDDVSSHA